VHGERASVRAAAASRRPLSPATTNGPRVGTYPTRGPFVVGFCCGRVSLPGRAGYPEYVARHVLETPSGGLAVAGTVVLVLADGDGSDSGGGLIALLIILLVLWLLLRK
jgi:hypothetical protein